MTRRNLLAAATGGLARAAAPFARIAITLDLEMSRNFPRWEDTHWDYEKGNLDEDTRRYAVEAARRVKARGGRIHFFLVGRVLEQENIRWIEEIVREGHPVGNHTYDHVNVMAKTREEIQHRFRRAPWLIEGRSIPQAIEDNIRLTTAALERRLGIRPNGFRTPGGFAAGLSGREDLQRMLLGHGFAWASSAYPRDWQSAQPSRYPTGLVEIPMSPVSDIGAFRNQRWKLEQYLPVVREGVTWAIENAAVYDFLGHPSCLLVTDPHFRVIDLICDLVESAAPRARLATLDAIAAGV